MSAAAAAPVLLFYQEYEADTFLPYDRYLKRALRPAYRLLHRRQKHSGFFVSFQLLLKALRQHGAEVRVNDYRLARRWPAHPVGIVGYPVLLEGWRLPNPALLGPSLYDHPGQAPDLMRDPRFEKYLVLAPWVHDMFRPHYGSACVPWFAGIDTEAWPDLAGHPKDLDVLVYDKIRWERERLVPELLEPILQELHARGRSVHVVRYKQYDHRRYRDLLARARSMVFVCEHETQGLAYQEAMAANVPILAWDNGYWRDPLWQQVSERPIPASSVPFFATECGLRFASLEEFPGAFERFWSRLATFRPRRYVEQHLSPARSAEIYLDAYWGIARARAAEARGLEPEPAMA